MGNRDRMPGPVSLEEYAAQQVRDWAEHPMDLSGLGKLPEIAAAPSVLRPVPRPHLNSDITESVTVQAVRPRTPVQQIADKEDATAENSRIARGLEESAKYTGRVIDGQHFGTAGLLQVTRGPKPYRALRAIKRIAPIFKGRRWLWDCRRGGGHDRRLAGRRAVKGCRAGRAPARRGQCCGICRGWTARGGNCGSRRSRGRRLARQPCS